MSILIKGMEMPKSCEECALNYDSFACIKTGNRFYRNDRETDFDPFKGRLEDCPLVPVPPHGRLIDADALHYLRIRIAHPSGDIGGWNAVVMSAEINNAPTIIPAEEAKDTNAPGKSYVLFAEEGRISL